MTGEKKPCVLVSFFSFCRFQPHYKKWVVATLPKSKQELEDVCIVVENLSLCYKLIKLDLLIYKGLVSDMFLG